MLLLKMDQGSACSLFRTSSHIFFYRTTSHLIFSLFPTSSHFFLSDHFSSHIFSLSDHFSYFLLQFQSLSHIFIFLTSSCTSQQIYFKPDQNIKKLSNFQLTYQDIQTTQILQNINCHSSRYDAHPQPAPPIYTKVN